MTGRRWIIGLQALVVVILVLTVYLTLLRPEPTSPLREVDMPGGGAGATQAVGNRGARGGGAGAEGNGRGGEDTDGKGNGSPLFTPARDQYADAVSALLSEAGGSAAPARATATRPAKATR